MSAQTAPTKARPAKPEWHEDVARFARPNLGKAIWQLINTFVPYIILWALMILSITLGYSYWITLALVLVTVPFQVRIFIFFHDAGHGSFFASPRANTILGTISGILTYTPYHDWSRSHATHHATAGNLDKRGVGDVWTMTVDEYRSAPARTRLIYRLIRNPLVMFGLGPLAMFLFAERIPRKGAKKRERRSVWITNAAILAILVLATLTIGLDTYLLIQIPLIALSGAVGIWLFYVQHQYQGVYWARQDAWDATQAALEGSSFYKLPRFLHWASGNIGYHHIHHLRPRVPNYHLRACYEQVPAMQQVPGLTLGQSLSSLRLNLYDEERKRMVSFRSMAA